jgi:hypothetical protein
MTCLHIVHLATLNTKCVVHDEERVPWGQTLLSLIDRCSVRASVARCPVRIGREETDKSWPHLMARLPRLSDSDPGTILLDFCISQIRSQCCSYHLSRFLSLRPWLSREHSMFILRVPRCPDFLGRHMRDRQTGREIISYSLRLIWFND